MRQRILPLALLLAFTAGCSGVSMLDGSRILTRAGWQHPERIVAELEIGPGDRVADIGAGDGYFLPYFSSSFLSMTSGAFPFGMVPVTKYT